MAKKKLNKSEYNRKQAKLNKGQSLVLIEFVKKNKALWMKSNSKYKDLQFKDKLWTDLKKSNKWSHEVKTIKQRWTNLRSNFVKK